MEVKQPLDSAIRRAQERRKRANQVQICVDYGICPFCDGDVSGWFYPYTNEPERALVGYAKCSNCGVFDRFGNLLDPKEYRGWFNDSD